jgi:glycosyltransferase involved in cell wall biosynthesis
MKKLLLISNDKIFLTYNNLSSKYNDTLNIIEGLNKFCKIELFSSISKINLTFSIKLKKEIKRFSLISILKKTNYEKIKVFMISITPRNFLFFVLLKIFKKKIEGFVYLRSNGYIEYRVKFGLVGHFFYNFMSRYICKYLKIITVSKELSAKKKCYIIQPSELNHHWFKGIKFLKPIKPRILYLGRFRKEKGIYSFINLTKKFTDYKITFAGDKASFIKNAKHIKFIDSISKFSKVINLIDSHNIFVLPSYTEGSPKVLIECLARKRPIIVFEEIKHVKQNYKGVFVCKRDEKQLKKKIQYILINYKKIQKQMSKNNLPTKKNFHDRLKKIVNE